MKEMEIELDAAAARILARLPPDFWQRVDELNAVFADLLAQPLMDPLDVEGMAEAVVGLYDEIGSGRPERQTGPESPVSKNGDVWEGRTARPTTSAG